MTKTAASTAPEAATPSADELIGVLQAELHDVNPEVPLDLAPDRHLIDELGVDSLDLIEFVARVEYDYNFLVPDEDIDRLVTLDAIAAYMIEAIGAR